MDHKYHRPAFPGTWSRRNPRSPAQRGSTTSCLSSFVAEKLDEVACGSRSTPPPGRVSGAWSRRLHFHPLNGAHHLASVREKIRHVLASVGHPGNGFSQRSLLAFMSWLHSLTMWQYSPRLSPLISKITVNRRSSAHAIERYIARWYDSYTTARPRPSAAHSSHQKHLYLPIGNLPSVDMRFREHSATAP